MVNTWPLKDLTSGQALLRAATQYPVFRGHIATILVQINLKEGHKAYNLYMALDSFWASGWSTHGQAGP